MRLLITILIIVTVEAKKNRLTNLKTTDASSIDARKVDVYPEHFRYPVPFGHLFRNGMGDPKSDLKQPIDSWELGVQLKKDRDYTKYKDQIIDKEKPPNFASLKDEYLYKQEKKRKTGEELSVKSKRKIEPPETKPFFDWSSIHERNSAIRKSKPYLKKKKHVQNPEIPAGPTELKKQYFDLNSFDLSSNKRENTGNWSSCDDYRKAINFHPKYIININWVPFYVWSTTRKYFIATVHRFSYPTKKLVKQYKEEFGPYLNKSIDWDQPKLVLKEGLELLLIAQDRIGLFNAIPNNEIPPSLKNKQIHVPSFSLRLKIVHPYLAIIHCENQFATIMAVAGKEPSTEDQKISEAKRLKFRGKGFPVYRNLEMETMRTHGEMLLKAEIEKRKFLPVDERIARSHFLDKD